ncbi:hypothetical protein C5167_006579 [Papaver somniferum]|uniref:BED-type domain-containing protein n=1 Tax=Papaver somniferum TaxID=3469 RepID=A0A4Y7JDU5_PAPSO|nr:hypothetical protein C5167_006579 [Papaver somniferum]
MDVSDLVETTPTSNVTDSQLPSPATGGTKKRKLTSIIWKGFEQIEEVDPDYPQRIKRLKLSQCKICDRKFSGDPKAGTSHLKRHMDSCLKKNQSADETQTLIAPIGSEDPFFQWFINDSFHPRFVKFSRATKLANDWGISMKIFSLSLDNASANTVSVQRIKVMLPDLPSKGDLFHNWEGLTKHRHMNHLKDIIVVMEKKFVKYWGETPILFGIGCILDPRLNLRGLETTLADIQSCFSTSAHVIRCHAEQKSLIVAKLKSLFEEYAIMLNEQMQNGSSINSISNGNQPPLQSVLQMQEETISDDEDDSFWQSRSQNRRDPLSSASEELTRYFAEPESATFEDMKNFDILGWWKANEKRYPVLSCIARDVLAVPVSTVASESAFSLGKRVLSDYRSSLTPQMLECCVILKDWWKAELKNRTMTLDPLNDDITPVDDENDVSESSCVSLRLGQAMGSKFLMLPGLAWPVKLNGVAIINGYPSSQDANLDRRESPPSRQVSQAQLAKQQQPATCFPQKHSRHQHMSQTWGCSLGYWFAVYSVRRTLRPLQDSFIRMRQLVNTGSNGETLSFIMEHQF